VNCDNVINCYEAGANVIVSGSGSKYNKIYNKIVVNAKDP